MLTVIGISGKKQSGKDTLCRYLTELSATPVTRIGFADALKDEVAKACGVTVEFIEQHKPDFRIMLQWFGTDFRRKFHGDNYWVNKLLYKLNEHGNNGSEIIVIPDVRFISEATVLKQIDAHLVRVNRYFGSQADGHSSETELDNYPHFDTVVNNDMEIQKMKMHAENLLRKLKLPLKGSNDIKHIPATGVQTSIGNGPK